MSDITRRRFILNAAGLLVPLGMGKIAHADLFTKVGTQAFKTLTFTGVTLQLDTATGFITQSSIDLRPYQNRKITIQKDGSNYVTAWVGGQSVGGETYGAEQVNNGTFADGSHWTLGGSWSIGSGVLTGHAGSGARAQNDGVVTLNALHKIVFTISAYTSSSTAPYFQASGGSYNLGVYQSAAGTFTQYLTSTYASSVTNFDNNANAFLGSISSVSTKQVLSPSNGSTPGTYGAILTSTKGGAQGVVGVTGSPWNAGSFTIIISAS